MCARHGERWTDVARKPLRLSGRNGSRKNTRREAQGENQPYDSRGHTRSNNLINLECTVHINGDDQVHRPGRFAEWNRGIMAFPNIVHQSSEVKILLQSCQALVVGRIILRKSCGRAFSLDTRALRFDFLAR